ncbi:MULTISPECIES: hypothetical protein [unclassified Rhizobium]|uniref:hypothetical protein n=1 Tax=unclassified Rhizobium TaxID=2613769 RepID=UPI0016214C36|nr:MULTISPECIES: hypothetical protein [unclassified Rhizobium]MBB3297883.1 hypothetical protein [Rhizobium sp. BK112]MBB4177622.1 hypothetical protein [Rhizobium sp. BK109]
MEQDLDLFGNPYERGRSEGRPSHVPSEESIINVMVLVAAGQTNKEVAGTLGLDVKTLRKHYDHLLKQRNVMLARLRTKLRTAQIQQGLAGSAAALSGALKMLDAVSAEKASRELQSRAANKPAPKGYVSKKEQRLDNARAIGGGGRYAVPVGPRLIANNGQSVASGEEV